MLNVLLTWIEEQQELHADVVGDVELEFRQLVLQLVEMFRQGGHAEESQAEEVELLSVVEGGLVR